MHTVAEQFGVSVNTVGLWVRRAQGARLDRVDFSSRKPGCTCAWNRVATGVEQRIVALRKDLREQSVLGEYGAQAIQRALEAEMGSGVPSIATINRALSRHGLQDGARRIRRPAPPKGWYLPRVVSGQAELDCFDFIEELKIASGPLVWVLNGTSVHGGLVDSWPLEQATAKLALECVLQRWQRDGLPAYAQFDNGTQFQGAHQFPDTVGRISRMCLALGVIPVFAPPREPGLQNAIEAFNGLWLAKVWQRWEVKDFAHLQTLCDLYVAAHRARNRARQERAPERHPMPCDFTLNLNPRLKGTMIYVRRTNERGHAHLLGRSFEVCARWPHRLVRCEVDFTHEQIRFYALRRRDPEDQPLLHQVVYRRPHKPFQGDL
jgi:hypothetical protein